MVSAVRPPRFSRYLLRTTDVEAAAAFYDAVLDHRGDGILPLHESAIARGARPHWLGHVQVGHGGAVDTMITRFVERGAMHLGPPPGVADFAIFRDAGGAIVAVTGNAAESSSRVVWHQLSTLDPQRAAANYSALFGWSFAENEIDLGTLGRHRRFAFDAGESFIGQVSGIEGRPEVHAHWLFFFAVPSLDLAVDRVRTKEGTVLGPIEFSNGARVAVCEDPQGAAFGLIEAEDAVRLAEG